MVAGAVGHCLASLRPAHQPDHLRGTLDRIPAHRGAGRDAVEGRIARRAASARGAVSRRQGVPAVSGTGRCERRRPAGLLHWGACGSRRHSAADAGRAALSELLSEAGAGQPGYQGLTPAGPRVRTAYGLLGPTASGKSRLALALAERLPIEIVSVDSAQVYRGMDIGTAKPSPAERAKVRHHLVDV